MASICIGLQCSTAYPLGYRVASISIRLQCSTAYPLGYRVEELDEELAAEVESVCSNGVARSVAGSTIVIATVF